MFKRLFLFIFLLLIQVVSLTYAQGDTVVVAEPDSLMQLLSNILQLILGAGVVRWILGFIIGKLPKGIGALVTPFAGAISNWVEKLIADAAKAKQEAATLELNRKEAAAAVAVDAVEQLHKNDKVGKSERLDRASEILAKTIKGDSSPSQIRSKEEAEALIEAAVARKKKLDQEYQDRLLAQARAEFEAIERKNAAIVAPLAPSEPVSNHEA